ncbi:MAG TPA: alpha/beta hydrolase [Candidatus Acidoferrales bacterium]|nr:alpha/beta hydrolase [Candidatus Acidoferrales bacterium]
MNGTSIVAKSYLIDGKRLEAVRIEARHPHLPTIVMLHEGLGSIAHWRDFPVRLAEETGAAVFVYSRYGHGQSDPFTEPQPVSYMHHQAQTVLPQILKKAGIERPVLLGHSDGASIAILYAGMFPDSPAALVLEAPHVFVEPVTLSSIAQAKVLYQETDLPERLGRYHANADSLFWGWNNIWLDPSFRLWNIESFLDLIRCPVLVLQGAQDEYGTTAQVDTIRARISSTSAIIFENCRHAPHRDQRPATLSAINQFLRTLTTAQH